MSELTVNSDVEETMELIDELPTNVSTASRQPAEKMSTGLIRNTKNSKIDPGKPRLQHEFVQLKHSKYLSSDPDNTKAGDSSTTGRNFNVTATVPSDSRTAEKAHTKKDFESNREVADEAWIAPPKADGRPLDHGALGVKEDSTVPYRHPHQQVQRKLENQVAAEHPNMPPRERKQMAIDKRCQGGYPYVYDGRDVGERPKTNSVEDIQEWFQKNFRRNISHKEVEQNQLAMIEFVEEIYQGQVSFSDKTPVYKTRLVPQSITILQDPEGDSDLNDIGPSTSFPGSKRSGEDEAKDASSSSKSQKVDE